MSYLISQVTDYLINHLVNFRANTGGSHLFWEHENWSGLSVIWLISTDLH